MQATADLLAWAEKKGIVWDKRPAGPKSEAWRARVENTSPTQQRSRIQRNGKQS